MQRRRFLLCGLGLAAAAMATGCMGSKSGTTVTVAAGSADKLELVDWGKSGKSLRLKLKNKSTQKIPGGSETLFIKWHGKDGSGNTDRIMNFHLQPGASEKYEIEHSDMDNLDKVEIGIADARRGF
jgi:hypothetical protein